MSAETIRRFACFGGACAVVVAGDGPAGRADEAAARAERRMRDWHARFSRFEPDSELSELNRDPRITVPVSAVMVRLIRTAVAAARATGGLVDPTLLASLRAAGYRRSRGALGGPASVELAAALAAAPPRRPATPRGDARWREISVDARSGTVTRPPGLELDLGGVAKGVFGDILAIALAGHDSFAVDACGDLRVGGCRTRPRPVQVAAPSADRGDLGGPAILHTFEIQSGAIATSGIGRRAWSDPDGRPAHHLLDPGRGLPAFTGIVQATALATTGAEAELRAKAALLSGPRMAPAWLPDGGALVADDGTVTVIDPTPALAGGGESADVDAAVAA
jgi:FAD:protein FMN transferase